MIGVGFTAAFPYFRNAAARNYFSGRHSGPLAGSTHDCSPWELHPRWNITRNFSDPVVPAGGACRSADSPFRVRVEPVSGSRLERLGRSLPLIGKRYRRPDYVPPAALRNPGAYQPTAAQRPSRRQYRRESLMLILRAKWSTRKCFRRSRRTDRDLAASALFSARRWEFVPARDGDCTVPAEAILHYQFGPGAHLTRNSAAAQR